jgi:serine/threonine-protein kinase
MIGRVFLGRYEAVRVLGEGGMGVVYLARQLDLGRQVVVKVMHDRVAADPKFRERFSKETLLMARFQHPYAVTLYDAALDDPNGPCIIMEYIRGITLDALLRANNGRLNPVRVGRLLGQMCEVLQAAHNTGIVHRDLKPSNLMVADPDTPYERIKVMDFGLATLLGTKSMHDASDAEYAVGTPAYMCPEQVRGENMDHRGDLYSVGIMLYEMLTGQLPFTSRSTMELLLAQATEAPPGFAEVGAAEMVSPAVEQVILACLAKDPADRPQSARDLSEQYERAVLGEPERPAAQGPRRNRADDVARPMPTRKATDPNAVVHHLEAWMPETIATYKLRGFVSDAGGEVVESVPGRIRVQLGQRGSVYNSRSGPLSWLGLGRSGGAIDMELLMEQADPDRKGQLRITVQMRTLQGQHPQDNAWRARCNRVYCDLRAYLMGHNGAADGRVG